MRAPIFVTVALACLAYGQAINPDPVELVRKSAAAVKANAAKVSQYAYRRYSVTRGLDKNGKETDRRTETWDVIGLEGSRYSRLVMKDDKPLPPKDEKREEERLRKEGERRKQETSKQRRSRLFSVSYSFYFPYEKTADIYDLRVRGEETVAGRSAWVVEGEPKPGYRPADDQEKEALNYHLKLWLDREDYNFSRIELEVIGDRSRLQKGSVIRQDDIRNEDGVWLVTEMRVDFNIRFFKLMSARGNSVTTFSDYRKFQVDSRIIDAADQ